MTPLSARRRPTSAASSSGSSTYRANSLGGATGATLAATQLAVAAYLAVVDRSLCRTEVIPRGAIHVERVARLSSGASAAQRCNNRWRSTRVSFPAAFRSTHAQPSSAIRSLEMYPGVTLAMPASLRTPNGSDRSSSLRTRTTRPAFAPRRVTVVEGGFGSRGAPSVRMNKPGWDRFIEIPPVRSRTWTPALSRIALVSLETQGTTTRVARRTCFDEARLAIPRADRGSIRGLHSRVRAVLCPSGAVTRTTRSSVAGSPG